MTFTDFFRLTRANAALIALCALLGLFGGVVYSLTQPTLYSATATGYITAGQAETVGSASGAMALSVAKAAQYVPLAKSRAVSEAAQRALASKYPGGAEFSGVSASSSEGSNLFNVTATASTAQLAADAANAALEATAEEALRMESMGADGKSTMQSIVRLLPRVTALPPARPYSPTWERNLPLGLLGGLLLGYGLALARRAVDARIRTQEDVEEVADTSVLGIIPQANELSKGQGTSATTDLGITAESLRQLRTNLRFVSVDDPPRSIVVTSANPSEGKSTVAANLARVMAQSGQQVVLIDADLRRPTQAKRFGLDNAVGLTQVLAGDVDLPDALQPGPVDGLTVLGSGRIPPNPSELVGSLRMRQVLEALSADRTVIIDAPPVLPVTDAGLLTAAADGALLVTRVGKTHKEEVRQVKRLLDRVQGRLLGAVLNMTPKRAMGTATYGYGYGGYGSGGYGSGYEPLDAESGSPSATEPKRTKLFR